MTNRPVSLHGMKTESNSAARPFSLIPHKGENKKKRLPTFFFLTCVRSVHVWVLWLFHVSLVLFKLCSLYFEVVIQCVCHFVPPLKCELLNQSVWVCQCLCLLVYFYLSFLRFFWNFIYICICLWELMTLVFFIFNFILIFVCEFLGFMFLGSLCQKGSGKQTCHSSFLTFLQFYSFVLKSVHHS